MSSMEELRQRIGVINSRIGQINDQRNKNIGMRESLTTQLNQSIADYQAKYGVDLSTSELVDAEYNRVAEEKEKEVKLLEDVISKIEAGDYSGANTLLGIEPETKSVEQKVETKQSESVEPSIASQSTEPVASVPQVEQNVPSTPQVEQSVPPVSQVEPSVPPTPQAASVTTAQVEQSVPSTPVAPVMPSAPSMTPPVPTVPTGGSLGSNAESFLEGFEKPAAPTGVTPPPAPVSTPSAPTGGVTPPPANPMSFDGILGGTQFEA